MSNPANSPKADKPPRLEGCTLIEEGIKVALDLYSLTIFSANQTENNAEINVIDKIGTILKTKKSLIITPNIPEAEVLANIKINNIEDMILASTRLLNLGAKNILLKGGHSNSKILRDLFFNNKEYKVFLNKKINTNNTHGTGCTLSSAVATFLSCGKPINKSCELAIKYVNQSLKSRINYGKGHGPINHLNSFTLESKFK